MNGLSTRWRTLELDDLEHERPAQVVVAGERGLAQVEQALDARLHPGPFEERPLGRRELAGELPPAGPRE